MIPILNTRQIKELDAYTIGHEPVAPIDLMERACRAFARWFAERIGDSNKIGIICGTGNNGGDGLGIARLLSEWNYSVRVWVVKGDAPGSDDFMTNLRRLEGVVEIREIISAPEPEVFAGCEILVDAIFGSGLSRPAEGIYARVIQTMNRTPAVKVAVDIPSGLFSDKSSSGEIVKADHTVTFQVPKLAFLLPQSYVYTGEWDIVDIGLDRDFLKRSSSEHLYIREKDVRRILRRRSRFDHKGTYGHALIVAGGFGKMGAAVLAARAALRAGVGLLHVHVPRCGYTVMQTAVPEAMVTVDRDENMFTSTGGDRQYDALGVGPGIGQDPLTKKGLGELLSRFGKGVVIDADALNILAGDKELLRQVPAGSILTPHPKEFERLAGSWADDFERLRKQQDLAAKLASVVIVKGAFTSIATPAGTVYFNPTGNPGMATGGTGDVLTGVLTGLFAQGYSASDTAIFGVYLHGLAGDLASRKTGMDSLIPSDLVEFLPQAFLQVSKNGSR